MKRCLNLGCGNKHYQSTKEHSWTNADAWQGCAPDKIVDCNVFPYPFADNSFDVVVVNSVLEHVADWQRTLKEVWRICKPSGIVYVEVPDYTYAWAHPYHLHPFTIATIELFNRYENKEYFQVVQQKMRYTRTRTMFLLRLLGKLLDFFANCAGTKSQFFCERIWAGWFGGFEALCFLLKPVKEKGKGDYAKDYHAQELDGDSWKESLTL